MKTSVFFRKFKSLYLWGNLLAMAVVVAAVGAGVKYGLDLYTLHGEEIRVPDVRHRSFADAKHVLEGMGLLVEVSDTGYVKTLAPDCILEQSVAPGEIVKPGRKVLVVVNSASTPTLTLPDVIDNSSYREARAKLTAMGFKVGNPLYVSGEKDWVYGIKVRGRSVMAGQKVPVEDVLIIQVGDGMREETDTVMFADPVYDGDEDVFDIADDEELTETPQSGDDEFEVVTGPE